MDSRQIGTPPGRAVSKATGLDQTAGLPKENMLDSRRPETRFILEMSDDAVAFVAVVLLLWWWLSW